MNFKQAKIILQKIESMLQTMSLDEGNISAIERDLMRSYLEQFSTNLDITARQSIPEKKVETVNRIEQPELERVVVEVPKVLVKPTEMEGTDTSNHDALRKRVEENAKKAAHKLGLVAETIPKPVRKEKVVREFIPEPHVEAPVLVQKVEMEETVEPSQKDAIGSLFEFREAKELSEKLGDLPIRDLSTALGLNEKIFTINELFGGDKSAYDDTIQLLNTFSSFDDAKKYLSENIAGKYRWSDNERKKKAKIFIKMVRRRY